MSRRASVLVALVLTAAPCAARAHGCRDADPTVGQAHCRSFGQGWASHGWGGLALENGFAVHVLPPAGMAFAGTAQDFGNRQAFTLHGAQLGSALLAFTTSMRVPVYIGSRFYLAPELAFGGGVMPASTDIMFGQLGIETQSLSYVSVDLGAGVALPIGGRFSTRFEAVAALRNVAIVGLSHFGESQDGTEADAFEATLSPRAYLDMWLTPAVTLSVFAGGEFAVGDAPGFVGGLAISAHSRRFDGLR